MNRFPYQDSGRGGQVRTAGATGLAGCLIFIARGGGEGGGGRGRGCRTVLHLRLVLRLRLAVVVDCVAVHGHAGVVTSPTEHLRDPGAAVGGGEGEGEGEEGRGGGLGGREGGGGGFMAAGGPDSVCLRRGL